MCASNKDKRDCSILSEKIIDRVIRFSRDHINAVVSTTCSIAIGLLVVGCSQTNNKGVSVVSNDAVAYPTINGSDKGDQATNAAESKNEKLASNQKNKKGELNEISAPKQVIIKRITLAQKPTGGNEIIAEADSAGVFTIKKTAPSEYSIRFKGAKLSKEALIPQVAMPDRGLIRSVRAKQEGSDAVVKVFVDPSAELVADAKGGIIRLSALKQIDLLQRRMAQLADQNDNEAGEGEESEAAASNASDDDNDVNASDDSSEEASEEDEITSLLEPEPKYKGRLISLDLQDTDIHNALRIIAEVSNLNIITSPKVSGKVTLRLVDVPWDQALDVILRTHGLDKVIEGNVMRIATIDELNTEREQLKKARENELQAQPLLVRYIRVSYANAQDIKPLVETVITERGSVAVDVRTNQIIVKDVQSGIANVAKLIQKLDLRTPQVLLETQIVEAQRTFLRDLGSELGVEFIRSPQTGNPFGVNFPNSVSISGSAGSGKTAASFPAAVDSIGSAITALFDSADGSRSIAARLSALEREGDVRIISRPSVATINNKKAVIKSVEKIRVKTPDSGLSVATGAGAISSGGSPVATEAFEVGIVLEVTPQASPDYYVLLDINAKSSSLGATVVDGIPSEVERSATSTVLVSSGQTFALGGIYKITDKDTLSGVPFFKDMPVFGHLFRRSLVDNSDEELIFFITPRIVEGSFDDAAMKSTF